VETSSPNRNVLKKIDRPNVKLLFDVYHVQIMEGDLVRRLERHRSFIGHVQIAAVPLAPNLIAVK
jgi:hydroxypyruvate isomerase